MAVYVFSFVMLFAIFFAIFAVARRGGSSNTPGARNRRLLGIAAVCGLLGLGIMLDGLRRSDDSVTLAGMLFLGANLILAWFVNRRVA
jgi:hypothetical protein